MESEIKLWSILRSANFSKDLDLNEQYSLRIFSFRIFLVTVGYLLGTDALESDRFQKCRIFPLNASEFY